MAIEPEEWTVKQRVWKKNLKNSKVIVRIKENLEGEWKKSTRQLLKNMLETQNGFGAAKRRGDTGKKI